MRYRDVIDRMRREGHYHEADTLLHSLEQNGGSAWDSFYSKHDAADGLSWCGYARTCAERAYDGLKSDERRRECEREEQELERRRLEHEEARRVESDLQRQEEDAYWEHVNQQEQDAAEREFEQNEPDAQCRDGNPADYGDA